MYKNTLYVICFSQYDINRSIFSRAVFVYESSRIQDFECYWRLI